MRALAPLAVPREMRRAQRLVVAAFLREGRAVKTQTEPDCWRAVGWRRQKGPGRRLRVLEQTRTGTNHHRSGRCRRPEWVPEP